MIAMINSSGYHMTSKTEYKLRRFCGWAAMTGALFLTMLTGYRAHMNTVKETARLSDRQDVIDLSLDNDGKSPACVMDSRGNVVSWNLGMELLTGLSKEVAEREGIKDLMCDPTKMKKHEDGFINAFKEHKTDTDSKTDNTLKIVHCSITNLKTKVEIPVQISIRMREAGNKCYAVARVDKDANIQEFGKPSAERPAPK